VVTVADNNQEFTDEMKMLMDIQQRIARVEANTSDLKSIESKADQAVTQANASYSLAQEAIHRTESQKTTLYAVIGFVAVSVLAPLLIEIATKMF
jgi:trans-aconitate methyltransferase